MFSLSWDSDRSAHWLKCGSNGRQQYKSLHPVCLRGQQQKVRVLHQAVCSQCHFSHYQIAMVQRLLAVEQARSLLRFRLLKGRQVCPLLLRMAMAAHMVSIINTDLLYFASDQEQAEIHLHIFHVWSSAHSVQSIREIYWLPTEPQAPATASCSTIHWLSEMYVAQCSLVSNNFAVFIYFAYRLYLSGLCYAGKELRSERLSLGNDLTHANSSAQGSVVQSPDQPSAPQRKMFSIPQHVFSKDNRNDGARKSRHSRGVRFKFIVLFLTRLGIIYKGYASSKVMSLFHLFAWKDFVCLRCHVLNMNAERAGRKDAFSVKGVFPSTWFVSCFGCFMPCKQCFLMNR